MQPAIDRPSTRSVDTPSTFAVYVTTLSFPNVPS